MNDKIIVKSQKEWDDIPSDFKGYIYIESPQYPRLVVAERKGSCVVAWGNSSVVARENSSVVARENSSVVARENSSVVARENSSVVAWGNSSVEAWGNSSVVARENSSVVARENSSVVAWGNSSVVAKANVQIVQYSERAKLKISGNARIVTMPKSLKEFLEYHCVEVVDGHAILFKAVREDLSSYHDSCFKYVIGEAKQEVCDPDIDQDCSHGMHIAHKHWVLDNYRNSPGFKMLECRVPINSIILPKNSDGKVRTSELTVLREVPTDEWGIYGKILAKKWAAQEARNG